MSNLASIQAAAVASRPAISEWPDVAALYW
jgi:hypothetical protein